ncbi:hypothetical protein KY385_00360 [Candidatus Parcubacteria bacterium]|nr:hypothetical protein [Candidatus Parcubacteria bacterium]
MVDKKVIELHRKLVELQEELSSHADIVDDPQCAALCETSAEAINGLETAFDHFMNKTEKAWQK